MKKTASPALIIKKYENRRLYNTQTSQYINQEQVAQLVRDGHDVRVVDAATGEDLTRLILAQIVLEDAKTPDSGFPLDVLRQMIVASGKATQEHTLRYMNAMMEMYQNAYRNLPSPANPFEFLQGGWVQPAAVPVPDGSSRLRPEPSPPSSETKASARDVDDLKRRIGELESLLAKSAAGASQTGRHTLKSRRKFRRKS